MLNPDFHEEAACLVTLFFHCASFLLESPLQGLPQGLFQTVELWIPNAKSRSCSK